MDNDCRDKDHDDDDGMKIAKVNTSERSDDRDDYGDDDDDGDDAVGDDAGRRR